MFKKKLFLDALLLIAFVSLMSTDLSGIWLHEVLGLFVFAGVILHLSWNKGWILQCVKKGFSPCTLQKIINLSLGVLLGATIVTGILISRELFPPLIRQTALLSTLHHGSAYGLVGLSLFHLFCHGALLKKAWQRFRGASVMVSLMALSLMFLVGKNYWNQWQRLDSLEVTPVVISRTELSKKTTEPVPSEPLREGKMGETEVTEEAAPESSEEELSSAPEEEVAAPSLQEFLSLMICQGCSKHCPLISPRCSKGEAYQKEAIAEYEEQYPSTSSKE